MAAELKHVWDGKMQVGAAQAIWHADKVMEALVTDIFEKASPKRFIETGTHMGWTSHWIATRYPEVFVYTCEIMPDYFQLSGENLDGLVNVNRALVDSREFLRAMPQWETPSLFWLDAHFYNDHPLAEECRIVSEQKGPHLVLIDDYHVGNDWPGDTTAPAMVEPALGTDYWRPAYPYTKGCTGYILYVRGGLQYEPPATMRKNVP